MKNTVSNVVALHRKKRLRSEILNPDTTLIRINDVIAMTGLARATLYKTMKTDPRFPKPVKLSDSDARSAPVGFVLGEVQDWVRARVASRDAAVDRTQ